MGAVLSVIWGWFNPSSKVMALKFAEDGDLGPEADVPNPTTGLTLRHRTAMVRTWDLVRPDLKTHGIYFFLRLFREEPQLKTRFKGFMNKTEDQLRENKRLAAHGTTVLTAITSMVDNLDDVGVLVELLQTTGVNHKNRGIPKQDYDLLAPVLLNYLRDNLGSAWTSVADEAWAKALKVIMSVIVSGYDITEPNQS
ncbi:globin-like [Homarus americanus]|uniref:globin-like n=1 Tax=Homarus americanus TaxID=6706 RepID=UPI001C46042F|nr:globin-like [Homarus americanus]XP_042230176.1 globin-like [Homarus americanus]XP_042230177.1 globin-like [Homarus americanus]XP_042230178.1 globin-like [Homarus americanus]XP_042230179.1 globin-like [Homarus americanus]